MKKICLCVLALVCMCTFASCGPKKADENVKTANKSAAPVESSAPSATAAPAENTDALTKENKEASTEEKKASEVSETSQAETQEAESVPSQLAPSENKTVVTAETAPDVYWDFGIAYHLKDCKDLQTDKPEKISWQIVEEIGLRQCPTCDPPQYENYVEG